MKNRVIKLVQAEETKEQEPQQIQQLTVCVHTESCDP